jgi:para-aminobenzoate synthetase / 4-amino-4-deoxychorismate lyase
MNMVNQNEVLLKHRNDWLYFTDPHKLIIATELDQVPQALHEVERCVQEHGWHAAGFVSYEAAPAFDRALITHKADEFPYLWFGIYPQPQPVSLPRPAHPEIILDWQLPVQRASYSGAIDRIKEHIARGRTYQVNYTMRLQARFDQDPWEFFVQLAQSQNLQAAYVDTGRYVICSASPELFFTLDGETVTCRPMKGTARRGRTTEEDQRQADRLRTSEKDRAENVMIVDMIRNDLGRIARAGSVRVPALFQVERFPTLWQMTSTVTAETNASPAKILASLFPCASITGAPKVSTMKIIRELEPAPRRIYTGAIGYFSPRRKASFNVAIRTALIDRQEQQAEYGVGGGIVWDSDSADEYAEALLKAKVLSVRPHPFSLLETMLWTPEEGYFLQRRHVDRLLESAMYFDFPIAQASVEESLAHFTLTFDQPRRVRLLLDRTGKIEMTSAPIHLEGKSVHAALAEQPVDSTDPFLFHKTTRRETYEVAHANFPGCDDVLLYNERGELTEFTIGNLIVELDGKLVTPPVECGLLPGTFRAELLETGQVIEQVIPLHRLKEYRKVYRVNSVRKWEIVVMQ